jgi:predicted enzyme related to lactoylglutathione lyase
MTTSTLRLLFHVLLPVLLLCAATTSLDPRQEDHPAKNPVHHDHAQEPEQETSMQVQYLEIVTPEVDATCSALEKLHGVSFSAPEPGLGNARTVRINGGGRIGVRAPMHAAEEPVVRPYLLVDDINAAVEAAKAAGGEIAHPPLELPGHGTFAIYILGGIHHGLWQL